MLYLVNLDLAALVLAIFVSASFRPIVDAPAATACVPASILPLPSLG